MDNSVTQSMEFSIDETGLPNWFIDLGHVLAMCLQEVVALRPDDPFEYMAHWLYRYADSQQYHIEKLQYLQTLKGTASDMRRDRLQRKRRIYDYKESIRKCKIALSKLGGPMGKKDFMMKYRKSLTSQYYEAYEGPDIVDESNGYRSARKSMATSQREDEFAPESIDFEEPAAPPIPEEPPGGGGSNRTTLELPPAMKAALAARKKEAARIAAQAATFDQPTPLPDIKRVPKKQEFRMSSLNKVDQLYIDKHGHLRRAMDSKKVNVDYSVNAPENFIPLTDGTIIPTSHIHASKPKNDAAYPTMFKTPLGFIGRDPGTGCVTILQDRRFEGPLTQPEKKSGKKQRPFQPFSQLIGPTGPQHEVLDPNLIKQWRYSADAKIHLQDLLEEFESNNQMKEPSASGHARNELFERYRRGGRKKIVAVDAKGRLVPKQVISRHREPSETVVNYATVMEAMRAMGAIGSLDYSDDVEAGRNLVAMEAIESIAMEAMGSMDPRASTVSMGPLEAVEAMKAVRGMESKDAVEVVEVMRSMQPREAMETMRVVAALGAEKAKEAIELIKRLGPREALKAMAIRKTVLKGAAMILEPAMESLEYNLDLDTDKDTATGRRSIRYSLPQKQKHEAYEDEDAEKRDRDYKRGLPSAESVVLREKEPAASFVASAKSGRGNKKGKGQQPKKSIAGEVELPVTVVPGPKSSTKRAATKRQSRPSRHLLSKLTPSIAQWFLEDDAKYLTCHHPELGRLGIAAIVDMPTEWFNREFSCRTFYDHELYTQCGKDHIKLLDVPGEDENDVNGS